MKLTDGLFHKVFDEIGAEYPGLEKEHWIVDIGAAKLADSPEAFDVVVMPNLYGDILSDVAAQIAGSVGLAGSANIGAKYAMFEAIHGSAPRRANQNLANPSGLLLGAVMMLLHIDQVEAAERVHNAWLKTIEDGIHTYDIFAEGKSTEKVGTREFAQAVAARMGQKPEKLKPVSYNAAAEHTTAGAAITRSSETKELVGVDLFLDWESGSPAQLGQALEAHAAELKLIMLESRGVKVYPDGFPDTLTGDHWRAHFMAGDGGSGLRPAQVVELLHRMVDAGFDVVKTENLYTFDGKPGYSLSQGQ
jgi:isocitrate dehydrogenase